MNSKTIRRQRRKGAIAVLAVFVIVIMLGMVAFAIDLGYLGLAQTQLQVAADSAALAAGSVSNQGQSVAVAAAQQFASANRAAGKTISLSTSDIQMGTWSSSAGAFTPLGQNQFGNAVKVTVRNSPTLFFGKIFGQSSVNQQASAIATANPRDICFVIDLSGSMNDDTSPNSANSNSALMQAVYNEFGFATYPGTSQQIASALGGTTFSSLQSASGLLHTKLSSSSPYYIKSTDSSSTRKQKATSYLMDVQMASIMSHAIPSPNSSNATSRTYWANFFSYLDSNSLQLGYNAYLQYMMYYGRDVKPDGTNYTPLSLSSNLCACPLHTEAVGGVNFSFPPDEMPSHAARSALIAAIQVVQTMNQNISDTNEQDWVSIVTFDTSANVLQTLTNSYSAAMTACTRLQACSDSALCTNTETGLITAYNHIKPQSQGGSGRENANKIIVLLTDGQPNLQQSSNTVINTYIQDNPSSNYYTSGTYYTDMNAALMQTATMQGSHWYLYPVGLGYGCSYDFMDRMARMGATANTSGQSPRGTSDPTAAQSVLTQIFQTIITAPKARIVQ